MNPDQPVVVHQRLTSPHPFVVATQEAVRGAKTDDAGRLELGHREGAARLAVSRAALPRALRLLDALCKGAEARGWQVGVGTKYTGRQVTEIQHDGMEVRFTIVEGTDKEPHVLTKSQQEALDRGSPWGIPRWDQTANGKLSLRFVEAYYASRSNWNDGVRKQLEEVLTDVLDHVGLAFDADRANSALRAREGAEREARRAAAAEAQRQREVHAQREAAVEAQVSRWRLAQDLRAYSDQVRARLPAEGAEPTRAWLTWVDEYLHPLDAAVAAPRLADAGP
jgi:hypothetical protein